MEPRQRPRTTGEQTFSTEDLEAMLIAFGDDPKPLAETVRVLDAIIVDYVIETCHEAAAHAQLAGRAKLKVDDFQFALRHDSKKLGRVQELLDTEKDQKLKRRAFVIDEGTVGKDAVGEDGRKKRQKREKGDGGSVFMKTGAIAAASIAGSTKGRKRKDGEVQKSRSVHAKEGDDG